MVKNRLERAKTTKNQRNRHLSLLNEHRNTTKMKEEAQRAKSQISRKMNLEALKASLFENFTLKRTINLKTRAQEQERAKILNQTEKTKEIINKAKILTSRHNKVISEYSKTNYVYQKKYKKWGQLRLESTKNQ